MMVMVEVIVLLVTMMIGDDDDDDYEDGDFITIYGYIYVIDDTCLVFVVVHQNV